MRRCRSTTGSAAPPASAAPRRSRPRAAPLARPHDHGPLRRQCGRRAAVAVRAGAEPDRGQDRRGRDRELQRHQSKAARATVGQAAYNVAPPTTGRLLPQDQLLLLHRAALEAGREARDAGRVLRRSGASRRTRADDLNTITLSYTFYPAAREPPAGRRGRTPGQGRLDLADAARRRRTERDDGRRARQAARLPPGRSEPVADRRLGRGRFILAVGPQLDAHDVRRRAARVRASA